MNEPSSADASQETLFRPNDPWITNEKDTKPYILENLDNIKLSGSQSIAKFIINVGPYMDSVLSLENFSYTFQRQPINVINLKPCITQKDVLMPKHK